MLRGLAGKVFIVTGGGGGIGGAAARRLAAEGAKVAVVDLDFAAAKAVADTIGESALPLRADLSDAAAVRAYMDETLQHFGRLDGVFNNAALLTPPTPFIEQDDHYYEQQWKVNERAVFIGTREALRHFIAAGAPGAIVNTSALAGMIGFRNLAAYSASKFAVAGFSRVAAAEGAPHKVRVNVVCPGFVLTPTAAAHFARQGPDVLASVEATMPMGRAGRPEEVGDLAAWLLSEEASYVSGAIIPVDGALSATID